MVSRLDPSAVLPPKLRSELKAHSHLTTLWGSFGTIIRLRLKSAPRTLILKFIDPPVDSRSEGHLRKTISYRVERYFYEQLSPRIPAHIKVPTSYPVSPAFASTSIVLEDLSWEYPLPVARRSDLGEDQAKTVLRWLAGFHAAFWETVDDIPDTPPPLEVRDPQDTSGVWRNGGYWYFATRSEEHGVVRDDPYYAFLDDAAVTKVANYLADPKRPGRTLLHGDCKGANIMFSRDFKKCALYDFQYCGKGLGVVDLVYFLATSVDAEAMMDEECAEELLETYYEELVAQVTKAGGSMGGYTAEVMMKDLEMAMVDWFRFQAGWGFWGNSWVSEAKVKDILRRMAKGKRESL